MCVFDKIHIIIIKYSHINWSPLILFTSFHSLLPVTHFLLPTVWCPGSSHIKFILPCRHLLLLFHLPEMFTHQTIPWLASFSLFGSKFKGKLFKNTSPGHAPLAGSPLLASQPLLNHFDFLHSRDHWREVFHSRICSLLKMSFLPHSNVKSHLFLSSQCLEEYVA